MAQLRLSLLGAFEATLDGKPLSGIKTDKARALLIYLAVECSRLHRRQALAGLFWLDYPEEGARANLRHALANLRQVLGEEQNVTPFLLVEGETLQLNPESDCWVDVVEFERLAASNDIPDLEAALGLYRGGFLEGFTLKDSPDFDSWTGILRERYLGLASTALGKLAELAEQAKEYERAIRYARWWLALEPWQEQAHQQLMRLLALSGQRAAALAQYEACWKALKEELGVEPSLVTRRLHANIRDGQITTSQQKRVHKHNLPAEVTSFIGREKEIGQVKGMLSSHRLVTLTGSGGTGKTRLSLRVAEEFLEHFPDGVWLVELAPLGDPELVVQTVARALGMRLEASPQALMLLEDYLEDKHLLLILDNCEHLVEACARLADALLKACPHLHILTSSREGLGIEGEAPYRVPPLSLPEVHDLPPVEELEKYEAVRLFVERAETASPDFHLTPENAPAVAQICQRLDGIPLALELAAARVKVLRAEEIAQRLDDRFRLLTGGSRAYLPRYQTLRASIDWSYELLSPAERSLLQRLSVFAGSWTLEAAEYVGCGNGIEVCDVLDLLESLVNKSLVTVEVGGDETRYGMLETIRQYAHEKLAESGCAEETREKHLQYYLELAERLEKIIIGPDQATILERLEEELDNIRLALGWVVDRSNIPGWNPEPGLRLVVALDRFWHCRGRHAEGLRWLESLLSRQEECDRQEVVPHERLKWRAQALLKAGTYASYIGKGVQGREMLNASKALFEQLGAEGRLGYAWAVHQLGAQAVYLAEPEVASEFMEESLRIFQEEQDWFGVGECNLLFGDISFYKRSYEQAKEFLQESLRIHKEHGDQVGVSYRLSELAMVVLFQGDTAGARALWEETLAICTETNDVNTICDVWAWIGFLDWIEGEDELAGRYYEEILPISRQQGFVYGVVLSLFCSGQLALSRGDAGQAATRFEESLVYSRKYDYPNFIVFSLCLLGNLFWAEGKIDQSARKYAEASALSHDQDPLAKFGLGRVAYAQGDLKTARKLYNQVLDRVPYRNYILMPEQILEAIAFVEMSGQQMRRAACLLGFSEAWLHLIQRTRTPRERQERESAIAAVKRVLGEEAFTKAWEEGKAMTLEQAIAYAKKEDDG